VFSAIEAWLDYVAWTIVFLTLLLQAWLRFQ